MNIFCRGNILLHIKMHIVHNMIFHLNLMITNKCPWFLWLLENELIGFIFGDFVAVVNILKI